MFFPTLKFEGPTKKNSRLIKNEFDTKELTRLVVRVGVTGPPLRGNRKRVVAAQDLPVW